MYTFRIFFLCATEDVSSYNIYPVLFLIKNPKSRLDREESTKQLCLATSRMRLISLLVYLPQHQSVSDELFFSPPPRFSETVLSPLDTPSVLLVIATQLGLKSRDESKVYSFLLDSIRFSPYLRCRERVSRV